MLRIAVVDDRPENRIALKGILKRISGIQLSMVGEAENVATAVQLIEDTHPNVVLLDVEMPDGTGFDVLDKVQFREFQTIFVTAHNQYAVQAFRFSAVDYLLKPVDPLDLQNALVSVDQSNQLKQNQEAVQALLENVKEPNNPQKRLVLRDTDTIHLVHLNEIVRCASENNYTLFHLSDGRQVMVTKTLKEYDSLLSDGPFFRSHQSHLVNLDYFIKLNKKDSLMELKNGDLIPVSARRKDQLIAKIHELN
jgi:two-component system LytT family response regulator